MTSAAPARHRFTVDEYYRMAEVGLLREGVRVELIEGQIIDMAPITTRHAACVSRMIHVLIPRLDKRATVGVRHPVRLSDLSEPEPDVALLTWRDDYYAAGHPGPADVLLLIEVADTSLAFDREVKAPLYARAGVPELWVVDLDGETVEVFRRPSSDGYAETRTARRGDQLDAAGVTVTVDDVLG